MAINTDSSRTTTIEVNRSSENWIYILPSGDSFPRVQKQQYYTHRSQVRFSFGRYGCRCVPSQKVFCFCHVDSLKRFSPHLRRGFLQRGEGGGQVAGEWWGRKPRRWREHLLRAVFPVFFVCSPSLTSELPACRVKAAQRDIKCGSSLPNILMLYRWPKFGSSLSLVISPPRSVTSLSVLVTGALYLQCWWTLWVFQFQRL